MSIYLAGTGPHIVRFPMNASTGISTSQVDTSWVTNSININNTTNLAELSNFNTDWTEGWIHFEYYAITSTTTRTCVVVRNTAGTDKFRIIGGSSGTLEAQWHNGTSWVSIGSWAHATSRRQIDIYIRATASGAIEVYDSRVLVASLTGNFSSMGSMRQMAFGNVRAFASDQAFVSQILVAAFPTLFAKVSQSLFTAYGALTDWSGVIGNINESTPDTSTFITASVAGNKQTMTAAARSLSGFEVKGVMLQFSALRGGATAPTQIRAIVRKAGTNYNGTTLALNYGISYLSHIFLTDPSTGVAWTAADAGAATLELGIEAIA